jgi:hypothetical protein
MDRFAALHAQSRRIGIRMNHTYAGISTDLTSCQKLTVVRFTVDNARRQQKSNRMGPTFAGIDTGSTSSKADGIQEAE